MKFFKKYLMPCLVVALTVCLAACGDDAPAGEGGGGDGTDDKVLTPAENKAKFESIASDVLMQFTPSDHEAVLTALNDFTDFADNGGLEIERNAYRSVMGMMNSMADVCGDNNLGRMMDFTRAGSDDPEAITKALAATKDLVTPLGTVSINATHDAEMPVGIIEYKDGKRVYVGEVTPKQ